MVCARIHQVLQKPSVALQSLGKPVVRYNVGVPLRRYQHGRWPLAEHLVGCLGREQHRILLRPLFVKVLCVLLGNERSIVECLTSLLMRHVLLAVCEEVSRRHVHVEDDQLDHGALLLLGQQAAGGRQRVPSTRAPIEADLVPVDAEVGAVLADVFYGGDNVTRRLVRFCARASQPIFHIENNRPIAHRYMTTEWRLQLRAAGNGATSMSVDYAR